MGLSSLLVISRNVIPHIDFVVVISVLDFAACSSCSRFHVSTQALRDNKCLRELVITKLVVKTGGKGSE